MMWGSFNPATWSGAPPASEATDSKAARDATGNVVTALEQLRGQVNDLKKQLASERRKRKTPTKSQRASRR
jgi:hypothetical protein